MGYLILVLLFLGLIIALPIYAIWKASQAAQRIDDLQVLVKRLFSHMKTLEKRLAISGASQGEEPDLGELTLEVLEAGAPSLPSAPSDKGFQRPEAPQQKAEAPMGVAYEQVAAEPQSTLTDEKPIEAIADRKGFLPAAINWEQFMGVKLFAWLGGLALFLGVGLFLKYSFDKGLISPPVRVSMGLILGAALLVGGLRISREKYAVTMQALTSAGILILYADIFAACSFYHFISAPLAFGLMALVTATAFLLSVRLDAQAVAVLGLLGGFLTPPLLSTGEDRPVALFTYLGLLDVGLIAVALRKRWSHLALLAALATVAMQFGWVGKFFEAYKVPVAMAIFTGFSFLFVLAFLYANRKGEAERMLSAAAIMMPASALAFAFYLLLHPYPSVGSNPSLLFIFVFAADLALLFPAALRKELRPLNLWAGAACFLLLMTWTLRFLKPELLNWGLAFYLLFALIHSVSPVILEKRLPSGRPVWWAHLFVVAALLLSIMVLFKISNVAMTLWVAMFLLDVLAIVLAAVTASVLAVLGVLTLTALATALWLSKIPAALTGLPQMLFLIGGFAVFFFVAGMFALKKKAPDASREPSEPSGPREGFPGPLLRLQAKAGEALIPALSAVLPFFLLTLVVVRLPLADPSPAFGLAALMTILLLSLVRIPSAQWVSLAGLAGVVLLEGAWYLLRFDPSRATVPLIWLIGFYAVFGLFPFLFWKQAKKSVVPWLVAALAGPAQFFLIYKIASAAFANPYMGLIPAAFALPSVASLIRILRFFPAEAACRTPALALFGGVTLFFITLIFPIQLDREWITIGWALEGAALLWLLHRVPHEGLKVLGVALLLTSFIRLALNPAVLHYHPRSDTPILNWYLYAYGVVSACLFMGARWLAPPRNFLRTVNVVPILNGLGAVLAFLLVNIEIADYFSTGRTLTFEFSGNLARDMTYSLAWAIFAFVVLFIGIRGQLRGARYGGMGLLCLTVLKIFLHDLWSLGGLYRIGSFIGLALVLIPVSLLYQRFLSPGSQKQEKKGSA
jgi:uncharacterized membrane protein